MLHVAESVYLLSPYTSGYEAPLSTTVEKCEEIVCKSRGRTTAAAAVANGRVGHFAFICRVCLPCRLSGLSSWILGSSAPSLGEWDFIPALPAAGRWHVGFSTVFQPELASKQLRMGDGCAVKFELFCALLWDLCFRFFGKRNWICCWMAARKFC